MKKEDYPALYVATDVTSNKVQRLYLWLMRGEYLLLLIAATLTLGWSDNPLIYILSALVFFASAIVLGFRSIQKPDRDWYTCRALAESIKTSTWRYMMRAEPFGDAESRVVPRSEFRDFLRGILSANATIGSKITDDGDGDVSDQITGFMETIRSLPLEERKKFYEKSRIREQRGWYAKKAGENKKCFKRWVFGCLFVYILAAISVLARIAYPDWQLWPTEPLIVLASSIIGWVQIKKFTELASAYTLTAHEIGIGLGKIGEVGSEEAFSEFVNETELAFSREHTQWVARQHQD